MRKYTGFGSALLASVVFILCSGLANADVPVKHPVPKKKIVKRAEVDSKMEWWSKARFGMFIHWGVYSVPAGVYNGIEDKSLGEWIMHNQKIPVDVYQAYAKSFNPTKYDPEKWVLMAKAAGMKYIVITTKHHDGFAMFDSKASDWNIVKRTPYGKDVIKMLADACRKYNMKLGFYYSQANDWNNPGGAAAGGHWDPKQDGSFDDYIDRVAVPQIKEILNNYGDVAELWWDVPTDMTPARAAKFLPLLKPYPNLITNNRLGGGVPGDLETPEQYIPPTGIAGRYWEACMTMNDTWGFKTNDHHWKSSKTLIRNLVDIASKGGNYLLNVGPEPTGKFPEPIVSILTDMGNWMKVNSESIYGTTASPFKVLPWGRCTTKEQADGNTTLYLHVFNWPANGELLVPGLENQIISAKLLANGTALKSKKAVDGLLLTVPATALDENSTVIKLQIKGKTKIAPYIQSAETDGSFILSPLMADLHAAAGGKPIAVEGRNEANLGAWTDASSSASWQIKITKPGTYAIEANLAVADDGNAININSGDQSVKADIKATGMTGKNLNYQKQSLGEIKINKAGVNLVSITPVAQNWKYINLRTITLKPVN
jgi:alpha-L-fucosidase